MICQRIFALLLLVLTIAASPAFAVGTPAGVVVTNQAFVDYQDANGNKKPRAYSNVVTVTVIQVAAVSVQPAAASQSGIASTQVVFFVQIANPGNAPDTYNFTYTAASGWTPTQIKFYTDVNHNHVYDPGIDTPLSPVTGNTYKTGTVPSDGSTDLLMVVTVPDSAVDASSSTINLTATSLFNQTVTAVGSYTTTVSSAVISAVTTHTPQTPRPGDVLTYTVTLKNSGSAPATNVVLTNVIPNRTTYVPGTMTVNAVLKTDAKDADEADFNTTKANAVSYSLGTMASGSTTVLTFQAMVIAGTAATTLISDQADVSYKSGVTSLTVHSTLDTDRVATLVGIGITPATQSQNGTPGDQKSYQLTLTNYGNAEDTATLTLTSAAGWQWSFKVYEDDDYSSSGDYRRQFADQGRTVSIRISAGRTITIQVVATIPVGTSDRTVDTAAIVGKSALDASKTSSVNCTLTVMAPVFTLTKVVSPTGTQPPGTTLTYMVTLTNTGTGTATKVILTDPLPPYTGFVANSIKVGPTPATLVAKTDAPDGDGAQYNATANSVVIGDTTTQLASGAAIVMQFSVIIK
jgi:uncharacterized repeat protein (TIGR01451 family)